MSGTHRPKRTRELSHRGRLGQLSIRFGRIVLTRVAATFALLTLHGASLIAQTPPRQASPDPFTARQMHDAIAAAQAGDEPRALEIVRALTEKRPRFVPALKLEGMLLQESGRPDDALVAYESALTLAPNDPDLMLKAGSMNLVSGHLERATSLLTQRLRLLPADEDASYYLAQALHLQGENDHALAVLKTATGKNAGHPPLWQKFGELLCSAGQYAEALPWLQKARQADSSLERLPFDIAVANYGLMNLNAAAEAAAEESRLQPGDLDNWMLLATVEIKQADYAAANEALQKVLAAHSEDAAALIALGHCQVELKQYPAAIETLDRALQIDPTQTLGHFFLSRAYAGLSNVAEAQHQTAIYRELQQHIDFAPSTAEAKRNEALLQHARTLLDPKNEAQKDEAAALRLLKEGNSGPVATSGSSWVLLGSVYLSMGRVEEAQRCFYTGLRLDSKTPDANAYLGNIALEQDDLAAAESYFGAELARDANHVFATAGLGAVRSHQQRWREAADLIARSKTTNPTLLYLECNALFHLGDTPRATLVAEAVATYARGDTAIGHSLDALLRRNGQAALADRLAATSHPPLQ